MPDHRTSHAGKPKIRAYVVGPQSIDLDLFYTLPTALGEEWEFEHLSLEREAFTLELLPDVHQAHGVRNAILVVEPSSPTRDRYTRLAVAHAWREGVRRFVLLLAGKQAPGPETRALEEELRVLLDSLGDGGAAPCIRTALTRCAGRTDAATRGAMLELLEAIGRVFPPGSEDATSAPLPASFADERAILDAVAPLIRSGTMIGRRAATLDETAALRGGAGGSHAGGWPYLLEGERWPDCPRCRRPIPCLLQLDARDALHATPAMHRLHVVYRCESCYDAGVVVRHYDAPTAAGRRPPDPEAPLLGDPSILVAETLAHMLPKAELVEAEHPDVIDALRRIDDDWGRLYWWAESAMGMSSLRIPDHLGGWQTSQYPTHPACACDAKLVLVSSTQWGDAWHSLWACPEHPDLTHFVCHK